MDKTMLLAASVPTLILLAIVVYVVLQAKKSSFLK